MKNKSGKKCRVYLGCNNCCTPVDAVFVLQFNEIRGGSESCKRSLRGKTDGEDVINIMPAN
jgi:hypothetical protein